MINKKGLVDKNDIAELNTSNNKNRKYKIKAIQDSTVYAK